MIAYDSNVLIYYLENSPEFGDAAAVIIESSNHQGAVLSSLLLQEVLSGFALRSPEALQLAEAAINALQQTTFTNVTPRIAKQAAKLTADFGRKIVGYDAIHLATALEHGASHFYTNDKQLVTLGKIQSLKIVGL